VLGIQSVPDGLATGILAGVSPLAGLNAYLVGTITGAAFASSTFMVVQGTGAMAMVISDVPEVQDALDPDRAVFTLAIVTGIVMLAAGLFKLGRALRFVSNAVMVGFMNAVGVSIALGQIGNLTGYAAEGGNRVVRAINTALSPASVDWRSVVVGVCTIALIVGLERTRLKSMGLVVAVIVGSAIPALLGWTSVATLAGLDVEIGDLPRAVVPDWGLVPELLIPALSLALVGLIQGAGISATFANPDGSYPDASRDFTAQGAANLASGALQGMPVGGSVSASLINRAAGARSRTAPLIAGLVMVIVILVFGESAEQLALPSLAGLLILVGIRSIKPASLAAVWRTGLVQKTVMVVTFALTMVLPLQYAVMVGVGLSVVLHVVLQSNQVAIKRRVQESEGYIREIDPPRVLPADEVVVLQPYGSLFFAAAPAFEQLLPDVAPSSRGSVVIVRLRGRDDLGSTFVDVLARYAESLEHVGSRLLLVSVGERIQRQLDATGVVRAIGPDSIYDTDDRVGAAMERAISDAKAWMASQADPSA
jgi:SulP family sulfate permease